MKNERITELQNEIEAEQRRADLEAELQAEKNAQNPVLIAEKAFWDDTRIEQVRHDLARDVRQWHANLLEAELAALDAIEKLESRRLKLGERGQRLQDNVNKHFRAHDVRLETNDDRRFAPEAAWSIRLELPTIRLYPEARVHLQDRHADLKANAELKFNVGPK
jgi:oligoendopeptidase F